MPTRQEIVDEARKYLGVPWIHQGRTQYGIDCAGLLVLVYNALYEVPCQDYFGYNRRPVETQFYKVVKRHLDSASDQLNPKPGDVAVMRVGRIPVHCGIFGEHKGQLTMIHSFSKPDIMKCIETLYDDKMRGMTAHVLSFPDVED